jgi:hypothetical protein
MPLALVSLGFAGQTVKPLPEQTPIEDNYYDPDKVIEGPIPHPSDIEE